MNRARGDWLAMIRLSRATLASAESESDEEFDRVRAGGGCVAVSRGGTGQLRVLLGGSCPVSLGATFSVMRTGSIKGELDDAN